MHWGEVVMRLHLFCQKVPPLPSLHPCYVPMFVKGYLFLGALAWTPTAVTALCMIGEKSCKIVKLKIVKWLHFWSFNINNEYWIGKYEFETAFFDKFEIKNNWQHKFLFTQVAEPHGWDANDVMNLVGKVLQTSVDEDDLITGIVFILEQWALGYSLALVHSIPSWLVRYQVYCSTQMAHTLLML